MYHKKSRASTLPISVDDYGKIDTERWHVPQKSRASTLPISVDDYGKIDTERWHVPQKSRASTLPISVDDYGKIDTERWHEPQKSRTSTLPISVDDYGKIDTERWIDTTLDAEIFKTRFDKDLITSDEKQDNEEFCGIETRETSEIFICKTSLNKK